MQSRKANIEAVRLLSVVIVLLFHIKPNMFSFGYLGVDFFFILSGYFAANHLLNKKIKFNIFNYLFRRFLRIMPAIVGCIMVILIFQSFYGLPYETEALILSLTPVMFSVSNFYFWRQTDYFAFTENFEPLLHTWSTSIELQFFVSFALCIFLFSKYKKFIPFLTIIFSLCFLGFVFLNDYHSRPGVYFLLPFRLWEFAIGMIIFFAKNAIYENTKLKLPSNLGVICIFLLILVLYYLEIETIYLSANYFLSLVFFSLFFFLTASGYENNKITYNKFINFFSKFTFVIFVVHYPIISIFKQFFLLDGFIDYTYLFIIIILCSLILYRFTDYYYFSNKTKTLVSLTGVYLSLIVIIIMVLIRLDFTMNKDFKLDIQSSNLTAEILQYDIDNFKAYVTGSFDRDVNAVKKNKPILLVGDSFAKDFYNILLEGKLVSPDLISLHYVPANCGFLKVNQSNGDEYCNVYKNGLQEKLDMASTVIVANFWNKNTINGKLISDFNFSILRDKNLVFVHEKVVEFPRLRDLLSLVSAEKYNLNVIGNTKLMKDKKTFNKSALKEVKQILELSYYSSIKNCGTCFPIATSSHLLSHDGQHLTKAGALYFASVFEEDLRLFLQTELLN